ncbi:MAG: hypothetical protein QW100_03095 [Thermoplasmatales archaeon]
MVKSGRKDGTVIGVGHLGTAIASHFSGSMNTVGFIYDENFLDQYKVDAILQLKSFNGYSQNMDETLSRERDNILEYISGRLVFIITQQEGRFQESILKPLTDVERSTGAFVALFLVAPMGSDGRSGAARIKAVLQDIDMFETVDSELILAQIAGGRVADMNSILYKYIKDRISGISAISENSTALGISIHDIKMYTALYGPLKLFTFNYSYVNFSIAERDIFQVLSQIQRDRIKRVYMFLEIGEEVDSGDLIAFTRRVKNRLGLIDFRQGFIHAKEGFGLIILVFGA